MLEYLKNEANKTFTENGALTHKSSLSHCLDLFSTAGALCHASDEEIISRFVKAYTENVIDYKGFKWKHWKYTHKKNVS